MSVVKKQIYQIFANTNISKSAFYFLEIKGIIWKEGVLFMFFL